MVKWEGNTTTASLDLIAALLPVNRDYYTYSGSLTTPGCYQSVTWMMLRTINTLSQAQLVQFRTVCVPCVFCVCVYVCV